MKKKTREPLRSDVFRDEALELLTELESALLELEQAPKDMELVGRIFRALHTIKGSGAMYGFTAVSSFTHEFETAFDHVRTGRMEAGEEFIRLSLRARDQILALLRESCGEGVADEGETRAVLAELVRTTAIGGAEASAPAKQGSSGGAPAPAEEKEVHYKLHFKPAPELFLGGTNPLLLLGELRALGRMDVQMRTPDLPVLEEFDAEKCYLAWEIHVWTRQGADAIRDVFIFVEDQCELTIEVVEDEPGEETRQEARSSGAGRASTASIRVGAEKLDRLVNLVGELVTVQARLSGFAAERGDPEIQFLAEEVERLTAELRDNSMSLRMVPLKGAFDRLRRLVHDLSNELGKEVEFQTEGEETELDKSMLDQLQDPLVHLVRNSLDHGLEPVEERERRGKPRRGRVRVSATQAGASVLIRVSDDGRGLNREAIRARAVERGLLSAAAHPSEAELYQLILAPGFSTAEKLTSISGRGVGMDVVKKGVEALRGGLEVTSEEGCGTAVTLRLPLTLAIIDGLLVRVGSSFYALPMSSVVECVELRDEGAGRQELAIVRGEMVPYLKLRKLFSMGGPAPRIEQIVVVRSEVGRLGLVVDQVLGNHQTVIKSLGKFYSRVEEVSGATILGDGTVALIVDVERMVSGHLSRCLAAQVTP